MNDSRCLAPKGWHIPNDTEWLKLITYFGAEAVAGENEYKLRDNAINIFDIGINFLLGGYVDISHSTPGYFGHWWSSNNIIGIYASSFSVDSDYERIKFYQFPKYFGLSVLCLRDNVD